jgi:hypothetical protein
MVRPCQKRRRTRTTRRRKRMRRRRGGGGGGKEIRLDQSKARYTVRYNRKKYVLISVYAINNRNQESSVDLECRIPARWKVDIT